MPPIRRNLRSHRTSDATPASTTSSLPQIEPLAVPAPSDIDTTDAADTLGFDSQLDYEMPPSPSYSSQQSSQIDPALLASDTTTMESFIGSQRPALTQFDNDLFADLQLANSKRSWVWKFGDKTVLGVRRYWRCNLC